MQQSRVSSFVEQLINVGIGFWIALASQMVIFPAFGIHIDTETHLEIVLWFTLVSVIRGYLIRRYFNARLHRFALNVDRRIHHESN